MIMGISHNLAILSAIMVISHNLKIMVISHNLKIMANPHYLELSIILPYITDIQY